MHKLFGKMERNEDIIIETTCGNKFSNFKNMFNSEDSY